MAGTVSRSSVRGLGPLAALSGVVVLVAIGLARGLWMPNLHNGLLALAFAFVGAYVLYQRPGHREGRLFLVTGSVEALLFLGRQIGHAPISGDNRWWGWLGVWPTAVALALTTLSVICFPDGSLPRRGWRWVVAAVVAIAAGCAALSAMWPVEYSSAGVRAPHPINPTSPQFASSLWSALAHPAYAGFQVLWVVAVFFRWRVASSQVRRQLSWLISAATMSVVALLIGLVAAGTAAPGLLSAALVPVAAGWAIVHGQHAAAYTALTWLSRTSADSTDLPADLARAVAEALTARRAILWMGADELHAVGVWPDGDDEIAPTTIGELEGVGCGDSRIVRSQGTVVGAISVERDRAGALSLAESRLFDDLASQASLMIAHIGLADVIARERRAGHLDGLTRREREVLELMAQGRSNAAICEELHLSIKTVEPVVSAIFAKLGLHADAASNRRVLAVIAYLRT